MTTLPLGEERRLELAALASRAERANQPRHLVILALVLLAGSLVYLSIAWGGFSASRTRLAAQRRLAGEVAESASRYKALVAAGAGAEGARGAESSDTILSTIQGVGERAGLKNRIGVPTSSRREPRANSSASSTQMKWTYTVKDPSLSALLKFASMAAAEVPGLEVYSVKVRPEAQGWELVVVFSRWERDGARPEGS